MKWLIFEIVFAFIPLVFAWKERMVREEDVSLFSLLGRGELLLVAVALIATGLGELLLRGIQGKLHLTKMSLIGVGMVMILVFGNFYSDLAGPIDGATGWAADWAVPVSLIAAASAISINLTCLIVAEVR